MDPQMAVNMMWAVLSQQYDTLPEQAKQALKQVEVRIRKEPDRLVVLVRSDNPSEDTDKASATLISQLYQFLPEYLNKSFRVKVSTYE